MDQMSESSEMRAEQPTIPALPVRILEVFLAPAKLFDALGDRPVWLGAILVLIAVSIGTQLLTPVIVPEEVRRAAAEAQISRFMPAGTDPAVVEQQVEAAVNPGPVQFVTVIVATPILLAIISGLLLIAFNVILGGEARFKQLFSAGTHALYISLAGGLVGIALMALGSQNPTLTPGLLLPEMGGFTGRFLNGINIFSVWTCWVLGVAVSRIYPGRSVMAGATYLLVLYLLLVAGIAALGSLMAGLAG